MDKREIAVLHGTGDLRITWDHDKPGEVAQAREQIAALKAQGYSFFVGEEPADEVAAGKGELSFRRVDDPDKIIEEARPPRGRGRGRGKRQEGTPVAVPPMRGG